MLNDIREDTSGPRLEPPVFKAHLPEHSLIGLTNLPSEQLRKCISEDLSSSTSVDRAHYLVPGFQATPWRETAHSPWVCLLLLACWTFFGYHGNCVPQFWLGSRWIANWRAWLSLGLSKAVKVIHSFIRLVLIEHLLSTRLFVVFCGGFRCYSSKQT